MSALTTAELPVIDFALLSGNQQQQQQVLEKLSQAARDVGFFYLINHGIDRELLDEVQHVARKFLPCHRRINPQWRWRTRRIFAAITWRGLK